MSGSHDRGVWVACYCRRLGKDDWSVTPVMAFTQAWAATSFAREKNLEFLPDARHVEQKMLVKWVELAEYEVRIHAHEDGKPGSEEKS